MVVSRSRSRYCLCGSPRVHAAVSTRVLGKLIPTFPRISLKISDQSSIGFMYLQATVDDLQTILHKQKKDLYPSRQRFTLPLKEGEKKATALVPGKRLSDYGLVNKSSLTFKDLGPQVFSCGD